MCARPLTDLPQGDYVDVTQARRLLPYAGIAVFVVAATVVALVLTTLRMPVGTAEDSGSASASPSAVRPATDLSPNGRLAYWRLEPSGDYVLWVANTDNTRRRAVSKAPQPRAVTVTKWAANGSAVAYVDTGVHLVVAGLDGTTSTYDLPPDMVAAGYRIVDHAFSPSATTIAVTVQRAAFNELDVLLCSRSGSWTRLTTTHDVTAGPWISEDELLVGTGGGVIGRLAASGTDRLHPLTSVFGRSPIVGNDGRVYFVGGIGFMTANRLPQFANDPGIWSVTIDGDDLRHERTTELPPDMDRLDGIWAGGFFAHSPRTGALALNGTSALSLPTTSGTIDRIAASSDGRYALAFADTNLVRLDLGPNGTITGNVLLLGSVEHADAWFPRSATLARSPRAAVSTLPAERFVFALGGHVWTMGNDGVASLLEVAPPSMMQNGGLAPRWSPSGDRAVAVEAGTTGGAVAVVIGPDGRPRELGTIGANADTSSAGHTYVASSVTWAPDGTRVAAVERIIDGRLLLNMDLNVVVFDVATTGVTKAMPGRAAAWTRAGIAVISNGTVRPGATGREGQVLEVWNGAAKRDITTVAALASAPRARAIAPANAIAEADGITANSDGSYVATHLVYFVPGAAIGAPYRAPMAFVVIRSRDGAVSLVIGDEDVSDEAWSPLGTVIGYTKMPTQPPYGVPQHAVVRDVESGAVLVDVEGRFAGWSPDGAWMFVARDDGLYARALGGGDVVRIAPLGVLVSTTRP